MASYAFATADDLAAGWRELTQAEEDLAGTLLDRAGLMLRKHVEVDPTDTMQADLLKMVSCSMVQRAMAAAASGAFGMAQTDAQMGPFSQTVHWANPSGDMYLTAQERDLLGIGDAWAATIPASVDGYYGSNS